jgi:N-dimethylarginine dimethylaminohydrolase
VRVRERECVILRLREREREREREGDKRIMEENGIDGINAIHEGRRSPLLAPDVKPDSGCETSSWRINLQEFPSLPERGDGDHGSYNLRRLLRTTSN